jgi:hypothetical protein
VEQVQQNPVPRHDAVVISISSGRHVTRMARAGVAVAVAVAAACEHYLHFIRLLFKPLRGET